MGDNNANESEITQVLIRLLLSMSKVDIGLSLLAAAYVCFQTKNNIICVCARSV